MTKKISILGSTGSIGSQTLDVISQHRDKFEVESLAAGVNIDSLVRQIHEFRPKKVSVANKLLAETVKSQVPTSTQVFYGEEGLLEVAANNEAEMVIAAMVGSQGLKPTLAAIQAGKDIGLANKETLVSAGHIITAMVKQYHTRLIPVDSEHSAIFQCLNGENKAHISRIIITASGGSFRDRTRDELQGVTVQEALKHPNWSMGAKITIDSATMSNKGLEVIEAHWLFNLPYEQIEVVLHPESIIHSLVEFVDHSIIAQLGNPDMRVPIQYALTYPERVTSPSKPLDLLAMGSLHFKKMDWERFPCLAMAYECGRIGGSATTVFNAANEEAVARFLKGDISFLKIEDLIREVINQHQVVAEPQLAQIFEIDAWARRTASIL